MRRTAATVIGTAALLGFLATPANAAEPEVAGSAAFSAPGIAQGTVSSQSGDLGGCRGGTIRQTFNTRAGNYLLQFHLAGNPESDYGIKHLAVTAGGTTESYTFDSRIYRGRKIKDVQDMAWQEHSLPFKATADTATVEFASTSSSHGCNGPVIDHIRVTPRP